MPEQLKKGRRPYSPINPHLLSLLLLYACNWWRLIYGGCDDDTVRFYPSARLGNIIPCLTTPVRVPGAASSAISSSLNEFSVSSFSTPRSTQVARAFKAKLRSTAPTRGIRSSTIQVSVFYQMRSNEMKGEQTLLREQLNKGSF